MYNNISWQTNKQIYNNVSCQTNIQKNTTISYEKQKYTNKYTTLSHDKKIQNKYTIISHDKQKYNNKYTQYLLKNNNTKINIQ